MRTLLNDETSIFNDILSKSGDTTISVKNIPKLMNEFYKYLYDILGIIIEDAFAKKFRICNLSNCRATLLPNPKTKKYDSDTVTYKAAQLWSTLPKRYKTFSLLDLFR